MYNIKLLVNNIVHSTYTNFMSISLVDLIKNINAAEK